MMNNGIIQLTSLAFPDAGVEEIFGHGPDQVIAGTLVPGGGRGRRVEGGLNGGLTNEGMSQYGIAGQATTEELPA